MTLRLDLCTSCGTERCFSHRRATRSGHPATGRQALLTLWAWRVRARPLETVGRPDRSRSRGGNKVGDGLSTRLY